MKARMISLLLCVVLASACKEKDLGPDLTSALVGEYDATYMAYKPSPMGSTPPIGRNATLAIARRTNRSVYVTAKINDGGWRLVRRFEGTIEEGKTQPSSQSNVRWGHRMIVSQGKTPITDTGLLVLKDGAVTFSIQFVDEESGLTVNMATVRTP